MGNLEPFLGGGRRSYFYSTDTKTTNIQTKTQMKSIMKIKGNSLGKSVLKK